MMMDARFVVAFMVLLAHTSSMAFAAGNTSVRCKESERLTLVAFKHGFVDHEGNLSSWGNAENQTECCDWEGVHCDQTGHVHELVLSSYNLEEIGTSGPLSPKFEWTNSIPTGRFVPPPTIIPIWQPARR
ncbi:receptor-like protein EIX1 [Prosopis cineraria]|uniref:receptor-like protein EIX1 n=1 Tax=Prosopis cineraria TaxID=364024 RepID=UPI00240F36B0|nr:receptor-like protein EIX1 [Prosopis cineraria]